MDRRMFVLAVGLALVTLPRESGAQSAQKLYRIAFIEAGSASANQHFLDVFDSGLRDLGYIDGKNVIVDTQWAEGQAEGFRRALRELIKLRPDVIVVSSTVGAVEAQRATTSIPIVFIGVSDPVDSGLVKSLAQPGGNLTGLSRDAGEGLVGKTVQLLTEIALGATRMAILYASGTNGERVIQAQKAALAFALTPLPIEVHERDGFPDAFAAMRKQGANALFVTTDPLTLANRNTIVRLAAANRIPAIYEFGEFARAGGLIAYAPSVSDQFRRAAIYVDKILKGSRPADLPIEQPTKFELVINLKAAKALGIMVPKEMLLRADEVIQ